MSGAEEGPQFILNFLLVAEVEEGSLAIPVPFERLLDKDVIGLGELAANAIHRISRYDTERRKRVAAALDNLEQQPDMILEVRGPAEGNFYIVLPEATENPE
jgi:hypothetical protein